LFNIEKDLEFFGSFVYLFTVYLFPVRITIALRKLWGRRRDFEFDTENHENIVNTVIISKF
jgi:hypothetical protein